MTDAPTAYVWTSTVPKALTDDEPMLRAHLGHMRVEAGVAATAEGYTLEGDPTVDALALVYVEDWSEQGGSLVSPDWARAAGLDPDTLPQHVALRLHWPL